VGRDADGSFKIEAFRKVADQVNEKPRKGVLKDGEACRDHYYTLKRWWAAISDLEDASGFGWATDINMVVAEEYVWDRYLEVSARVQYSSFGWKGV